MAKLQREPLRTRSDGRCQVFTDQHGLRRRGLPSQTVAQLLEQARPAGTIGIRLRLSNDKACCLNGRSVTQHIEITSKEGVNAWEKLDERRWACLGA